MMNVHRVVTALGLLACLASMAACKKGDKTDSPTAPSATSSVAAAPSASATDVDRAAAMGVMDMMAALQDAGPVDMGGTVAIDPGAASGSDPLIGKPAPELVVKGVSNKPAPTLRSLRGKIVLLHFFASWASPCQLSFPAFKAVADRNPNVVVVAVSEDDSASDVEPFLTKVKSKFATGYDEAKKSGKAFGVSTMPSTYLIDQKGVVRYAEPGYSTDSAQRVEAAIKKMK